jgi:hypothetical protein
MFNHIWDDDPNFAKWLLFVRGYPSSRLCRFSCAPPTSTIAIAMSGRSIVERSNSGLSRVPREPRVPRSEALSADMEILGTAHIPKWANHANFRLVNSYDSARFRILDSVWYTQEEQVRYKLFEFDWILPVGIEIDILLTDWWLQVFQAALKRSGVLPLQHWHWHCVSKSRMEILYPALLVMNLYGALGCPIHQWIVTVHIAGKNPTCATHNDPWAAWVAWAAPCASRYWSVWAVPFPSKVPAALSLPPSPCHWLSRLGHLGRSNDQRQKRLQGWWVGVCWGNVGGMGMTQMADCI